MNVRRTLPVLSVVAPVYNEVETLPQLYERIVDVTDALCEPFELVLVDDSSVDWYLIKPPRHAHKVDRGGSEDVLHVCFGEANVP